MSFSLMKLAEPKSLIFNTSLLSFTWKRSKNNHEAKKNSPGRQTHQDIVWFDISMKDSRPLHQFERQQQLLSVRPHRLDVKTYIFTVLLQNFTEVHAVRKEYKFSEDVSTFYHSSLHTHLMDSNTKHKWFL